MSGLCRGCGGTGLDHSLSPRIVQLALREITLVKHHEYNGVRQGSLARLRISSEPHKARLAMDGPLAHVLSEIERLGKLGYFIEGCESLPSVEPGADWACSWCHGTGVPQLSAAYMEMAVATCS